MTKTYLPVSLFPLFATLVSVVTPVRTRRAEAEALAARCITGAAADLLLDETSGARHGDRVMRALTAAIAWALVYDEHEREEIERFVKIAHSNALALTGSGGEPPDTVTLADAWAILTLEIVGVGGRHGAEGIGSARHPAFRLTCGKGRKLARDGAAWTGAIQHAREIVASCLAEKGEAGLQLRPVKFLEGGISLATWLGPHKKENWVSRDHHPEERPWYRAAATRGLLAASRGESGDASVWAELYNQLHKEPEPDPVGPNERARDLIREHGTAEDRRVLAEDDQLLSAAGGLLAADVVRWQRLIADHGGEVAWPAQVPIHHADHGIPPLLLWWALEQVELDGFFARTFELPGAQLPCGLHGPAMGDAPVLEEEVVRYQRTPDRPPSRCVARPLRTSDLITVIGTANKDGCQIFTAYGGPLAPREPGDPTLEEGPDRDESEAFWAQHALSLPSDALASRRQLAADDVGDELAAQELGQASGSSSLIGAFKARIDRETPMTSAFVSDLEVQLAKCRTRGLLDGASAYDLLALARERLDESLS